MGNYELSNGTSYFSNPKNGLFVWTSAVSYYKMPVLTRSNTTGPTKMITGVKRKFIEIVDSDDDTTTVCTDSETEYEAEDEDEIDDLKNDLHESEQSNDALINIIIKERETSNALQAELTELKEKYNKLVNSVKEVQNTAWFEFVCMSTMLALAAVSVTSIMMCNTIEFTH